MSSLLIRLTSLGLTELVPVKSPILLNNISVISCCSRFSATR